MPRKEADKMIRFIKAEKERAGDYEETVNRFVEKVMELGREYPRLKFYLTAAADNAFRYRASCQSNRSCFQANKEAGGE